jgi:beta-glucosidase
MTLEEKVDLVVGDGWYIPGVPVPGSPKEPSEAQQKVPGASGSTRAIPRLGIPSMIVCDGPAGLHIFNFGKSRQYYGTAWPIATLLASSWDTALVRRVGSAFGGEIKEYGLDLINAPGMNIQRNPLGGRNFEYYSEDPLITGHMAAALINGFQSQGVGNIPKHFFANNQETNRSTLNVLLSERVMREIYLRGWQLMIKQSNPWGIMSSYNRVNGPYTAESGELLIDILRKEWDYQGFVETDWYGGQDAPEAQRAGNNLLMPGLRRQKSAILEAVKEGQLDEKDLDRNVEAILRVVIRSPSFKGYAYSDNPPLAEHAEISRQAAAEGMVLLKNEGDALPVKPGTRVALFGHNALELIAGGTGSGDVSRMYTVSLADGMFHAGYSIHTPVYSAYADYLAIEKAKNAEKNIVSAMAPREAIPEMRVSEDLILEAADQSEIAILAIGRNAGENNDRKVADDYLLSAAELELIHSVSSAFHEKNKKVVVVLNTGGVVDVMQWREAADAILLAWQPGMEGGNAICDVLSGKVNPSGKLACTFPVRYEDDASAKNFPGRELSDVKKPTLFGTTVDAEVVYEEGIYVGYRYYSTFGVQTAYPFGYGLSYTQFNYSDLKVRSQEMDSTVQVLLRITNAGDVAGKEVAELYISAPAVQLDKPSSELKAFAKTKLLEPGESQELSFTLCPADLASFHTSESAWIAEAGTYAVKFGNAQETLLSGSFILPEEVVVEQVHKVLVPQVQIKELKSKSD